MPHHIPLPEKFKKHRSLVGVLADAGVPPPARWTELNEQLSTYLDLDDLAAQRLAAAVITPHKNTDLTALRAHALAEQSAPPERAAQVLKLVVFAVLDAMLDVYTPVAQENYRHIADRFNCAAERFVHAANTVDAESDPRDMVVADDAQRQAWLDAEILAAELDQLVPVLVAAAELAGVHITNNAGPMIAATVATEGMHRRKIWQAWQHTGGRTSRWGALNKLGALIRACDLATFQPYREPRPLIYKQQQAIGQPRGIVEQIVIDPEDEEVDADHIEAVTPVDPVRSDGVVVG